MAGFRPATPADLDEMLSILNHARAYLARQGLDQWQGPYPGREDLEQDVAASNAWVLQAPDGQLAAIMALVPGQEPGYDTIDGAWGANGPYVTVHRLAVAEGAHGGGAALRMLTEAEALARQWGLAALRTDTHPGNRPMQRLLARAGFVHRGSVQLYNGGDESVLRLAYDKNLTLI